MNSYGMLSRQELIQSPIRYVLGSIHTCSYTCAPFTLYPCKTSPCTFPTFWLCCSHALNRPVWGHCPQMRPLLNRKEQDPKVKRPKWVAALKSPHPASGLQANGFAGSYCWFSSSGNGADGMCDKHSLMFVKHSEIHWWKGQNVCLSRANRHLVPLQLHHAEWITFKTWNCCPKSISHFLAPGRLAPVLFFCESPS